MTIVSMYNTLQLNQGDNQFSEIGHLAGISSTDWSWSNLIADFDNDGHKDIYITNGLLRDIRNSDAAKTFPQYVTKQINAYILANPNDPDVTILDILDLDEALALLPSVPLKNYVYKNKGNLEFEKVIDDWGLNEETFSNGAAYADLDNDGDLDLVVNNVNERAYIYKNNATKNTKNNYLRVKITDGNNAHLFGTGIEIVTTNGKQYIETTNVRGIYSTSEQTAHFGLAQESKVNTLRIYWPDGTVSEKYDIAANQQVLIDKQIETANKKQSQSLSTTFTNITAQSGINFTHVTG